MGLIGPTMDDVRDAMIDGESGILATQKPWNPCEYHITERRIVWPKSHVIASIRTSEKPRSIRGLNIGFAWCDELAFWSHVEECWANLVFANRKGSPSEIYFGTTPLPTKFLRDLANRADVYVQGGSSYENRANLDPEWFEKNIAVYEGTRRGDQEIHGIILDDNDERKFRFDWIRRADPWNLPRMEWTVVGVDPAGGSKTRAQKIKESQSPDREPDATGIVVVSMDEDGAIYLRRDATPERGTHSKAWGEIVVQVAIEFDADEIVAERNYGGDMVETTVELRPSRAQCGASMIVQQSLANKTERASPLSDRLRDQMVFHVGGPSIFRDLEQEMIGFDAITGKSDGKSPNRLDAYVHAVLRLLSKRQESGRPVPGWSEDDLQDLARAYHSGFE